MPGAPRRLGAGRPVIRRRPAPSGRVAGRRERVSAVRGGRPRYGAPYGGAARELSVQRRLLPCPPAPRRRRAAPPPGPTGRRAAACGVPGSGRARPLPGSSVATRMAVRNPSRRDLVPAWPYGTAPSSPAARSPAARAVSLHRGLHRAGGPSSPPAGRGPPVPREGQCELITRSMTPYSAASWLLMK